VSEIDVVDTEYLKTMGARLLEGRWFRAEEMNEPNGAVIVDEIAARRLWPGTNAVGKMVCVLCVPDHPRTWKQVVGVVSGMRHKDLDGPPQANTYLSGGAFEHAEFLVVRSSRPTGEIEAAIRKAIATVDPDQPVLLSASMESFVAESVADRRFITGLLTITAVLALVMATAGVYGVTLFATSRRTHEIGIRIALGATSRDIQRLIFGQGFIPIALGLASGTLLSFALLRILQSLVAGLDSANILSIMTVVLIVSIAAAIAFWIPTRRATLVDAATTLREEK
jgi:hypothetical protein